VSTTDPRTGHLPNDAQVDVAGAGPHLPDGQSCSDGHSTPAVGDPDTRNGHIGVDTHRDGAVAGPTPEPTSDDAAPMGSPSARDSAGDDHSSTGAQTGSVVAADPPAPARNLPTPTGRAPVLADQNRPGPANRQTPTTATAASPVLAGGQQGPAIANPPPSNRAPDLADPLLALAADVLDDLERVRIANENRLRQLTRDDTDADGAERGFGLPLQHPDVARLAALVDALGKAEHDAELNLKRQLRKHPLGPWVKQARGVGEKQAARLLAAIGDPYWNDLHQRPRTVSELWAYCGYHVLPAGQSYRDTQNRFASGDPAGGDPDQSATGDQTVRVGVAATPRRGHRANWSSTAKMRAHLVAVSIVKAGGPYREVYDRGRAKYADALHATECKRCGPSGKPAQPGTPLSDGHSHARALRLVAKEVLKDLWREAKRLHTT
jgi:hypothetical protein